MTHRDWTNNRRDAIAFTVAALDVLSSYIADADDADDSGNPWGAGGPDSMARAMSDVALAFADKGYVNHTLTTNQSDTVRQGLYAIATRLVDDLTDLHDWPAD